MDVVAKAEKLALARKKLKEFEIRKNQSVSPSPFSSIGLDQNQQDANERESVVSDKSVCASSETHNSNGRLQPDSCNGNVSTPFSASPLTHNPIVNGSSAVSIHSIQGETDYLHALLSEKDRAYEQVKGQLQDLHSYYSQLHAAYSQLCEKTPKGDEEQNNAQIMQLQSALSLLVGEKTTLQSDLRKAKDELQEHKSQLNSKKSSQAEHAARSERAQIEIGKLQAELDGKNRMLERRLVELENERKESSRLQAQMLALQHDKNEAQARLKNVYCDKEALEVELKSVRKECQMKELYIKQLTAHQNTSQSDGHVDIHKLNEECESLHADVARLQSECDEAKKQAEVARIHYNDYGKQMSENYARLNKEFDEVLSSKCLLEVRVRELEDHLEIAKGDLQNAKSTVQEGSQNTQVLSNGISVLTDENVSKKVDDALRRCNYTWERKLEMREKEIENLMQEKDSILFEREQSLAEIKIKMRLLEEREKETRESNGDLLSLAEQLQNEKATVSRAVAQNRELKEQLIETEDRLIALTDEKLESELARQKAEHHVKQMGIRLKQLGVTLSPESSSREVSVESVVTSQPHSINGQSVRTFNQSLNGKDSTTRRDIEAESSGDEDDGITNSDRDDVIDIQSAGNESELARQLEETKRELEEIRSQLRRSHTQNEEMNQIMRQNAEDENQNSIHVELGQAVARINELAQENEQLRNDLNVTRRSLEDNHATTIQPMHDAHSENVINANISTSDATCFSQNSLERLTIKIEEITHINEQLAGENEELRKEMERLNRLLSEANSHLESTRVEDCVGQSRDELPLSPLLLSESSKYSVGTTEWARVELEKRFEEAMHQLADLKEQCDKLEHINVQLQLENDTIADHVILYQHQRRLIRERLRLKDEQMTVLEKERERISGRCQELQEALMSVLDEAGILKEYQKSSRRVRRVKRPVSRSYSHSTVDEFSGDEECIIDARNQEVPTRIGLDDPQLIAGEGPIMEESSENKYDGESRQLDKTIASNEQRLNESSILGRHVAKEAAVQKILDIITEIRTPAIPPIDNRMQCKQCIGEMQII